MRTAFLKATSYSDCWIDLRTISRPAVGMRHPTITACKSENDASK
jgi:hypothetical protein